MAGAINPLAGKWRYAFQQQAIAAYARVFDASQIERILIEVADDVASDPALVSALDEAREVAKAWDASAAEFAALTRSHFPTEDEISARDRAASTFGYRGHFAAGQARTRLDALLASG
jgi:hypothetical protein